MEMLVEKQEDYFYKCWLTSINDVSKLKLMDLILHYKSYESIWNARLSDLLSTGILDIKQANTIYSSKDEAKAIKIRNRLDSFDCKLIGIIDKEYPDILRKISNPPPFLYVKGDINCLNTTMIAVVGSRKATAYGLEMANKISKALSNQGMNIISGLALGIDSEAHKGCLEGGARTVAVLGSGIDVVYPSSNLTLYNQIASKGCVISELPLGTKPLKYNFPLRNRIISGLSVGVVVIEASENSGSLITADYALEQGREVFALPGNVTNHNSIGTNNLIKNGAKMITNVDDIFEELEYGTINTRDKIMGNHQLDLLSEEEKEIYLILKNSPKTAEEIIDNCIYNPGVVYSHITMLELRGIIRQRLGKYFIV